MKHSWADWWLCRGEYCRCWKMSLLKIRICTPAAVWWIVSKHKVERSSLVCCSAVSEMMCVSDGCWIKAVYILGFWLLSVSSAVQTPQELPGAILHLAHSSVVFCPVQQFMSMVCKRSRVSLFLIFFFWMLSGWRQRWRRSGYFRSVPGLTSWQKLFMDHVLPSLQNTVSQAGYL